MAERPKRTGLRTDPEDAEHYRRHHEDVLASLKRGTPNVQVAGELTAKGVPERTAQRIVIAVEQEIVLADAPKIGSKLGQSTAALRIIPWLGLAVVVTGGAFVMWRFMQQPGVGGRERGVLVGIGSGLVAYFIHRTLHRLFVPRKAVRRN